MPARASDASTESDVSTKRTRAGLQRHASTHHDALSGNPWRAAGASFTAGIVQATVLLPLNTVRSILPYVLLTLSGLMLN